MKVTVITMYRSDAEIFTQVVAGELTPEQRTQWRRCFACDEFDNLQTVIVGEEDEEEDDEMNSMFFRTLDILPNDVIASRDVILLNVDGENDSRLGKTIE